MICPKCNTPMVLLFTSYVCDHCPKAGQKSADPYPLGSVLTTSRDVDQALLAGCVLKKVSKWDKSHPYPYYYRYTGSRTPEGQYISQTRIGGNWVDWFQFNGTGLFAGITRWVMGLWTWTVHEVLPFAIGDRVKVLGSDTIYGKVTRLNNDAWSVDWEDGLTGIYKASHIEKVKVIPSQRDISG